MAELLFAYVGGLLTIINPCILPVLPIVLSSAVNVDRRAPIALAMGLSASFVVFGMLVATVGHSIGLTTTTLSNIGAVVMILFGTVLLVPFLEHRFEAVAAGFSGFANQKLNDTNLDGLSGQFVGGALLGAVWTPCIGPTLGGAIALASQGQDLLWSAIIMLFFAFGVSSVILGIGMGANSLMRKRANALGSIAEKSKTIMGLIFVSVGLMILFNVHYMIETWAVENLPIWLQDLSVAY